ncbi:iron chelate uptake ABC transporter family permease subunit [Spiractinospora alimapuensis]|uniref:FecCD family ABC transporter permease n=1 Tax=Spiractinospora alimapuensis TaxID=2820884 RepID=UPI001F47BE24|nr:iron chelate uptake ABC transporter family permease subunit [Spiractinospora alimapuensis]QVQ52687.1 iron chelate uptake ABC transporter family permease subunit [Spiractinospora alimapuensis]
MAMTRWRGEADRWASCFPSPSSCWGGSVVVSVAIGQSDLSVREVWTVLTDRLGLSWVRSDALGLYGVDGITDLRANLVWEMRLPRVLAAALVGAGLAVVGAVMQTLTRNPMADPYLLGISSGASLGAVAVIVAGLSVGGLGVAGGAFVGALIAFVLVLALGQRAGRLTPTRMILAGVAVGAFSSALTSFLIVWVADPHATQEAQFWLSGSLAAARLPSVYTMAAAVLVGLLVCGVVARPLNAFAFGEDTATSLGIGVHRVRWVLLVVCALVTGVLVAGSGAIGFVGLLIPHGVRALVGPDHRRVLPLSALVGATFLIWVDVVARVAFAPREMPVGIMTAMLGVPVFLWILKRKVDR